VATTGLKAVYFHSDSLHFVSTDSKGLECYLNGYYTC
jgi:hypothetical protein